MLQSCKEFSYVRGFYDIMYFQIKARSMMILAEIITNEKGQKVVEIDMIVFSSKRKIDWEGVEEYLKRYLICGWIQFQSY